MEAKHDPDSTRQIDALLRSATACPSRTRDSAAALIERRRRRYHADWGRSKIPVAPTVSVVDDDILVLARLQELVAAAGYEVRTANSGIEALNSLKQSYASIVVMDLNMPDMDGLDLRPFREHIWPGRHLTSCCSPPGIKRRTFWRVWTPVPMDYLKRTSAVQSSTFARRKKDIVAGILAEECSSEEARAGDEVTPIVNARQRVRHRQLALLR